MHARMHMKVFGLLSLVLYPLVSAAAEAPLLARLMPPSTVAYVEVTQADVLVEKALDPAFLKLLEQSKDVQKYYASEQYRQSQLGISLIEARMNARWPQIVRELAGSASMGFDPQAEAALLVLRVKNRDTLTKLHSAIVDLVELDAINNGKASPARSQEYQGVTGWSFGEKEFHAISDDLYLASNKQEGLKGLIDRLKDAALPCLTGVAEFQKAQTAVAPGQTAWGMLRMSAAREVPKFKDALEKQSDNPLGELLAGGILEVLKETPLSVGSLHVQENQWRLRLELPRVGQPTDSRSWFFAQSGTPAAPLAPKGTIASLLLNRDVAGMWVVRDELFDEATRAKMAQADAGLGLYFSGRDFGTQVLGELGAEWQVVVARQEFGNGQPIPAIKLPAVAVVIQMKQPDQFASTLQLSYQNIVGLANLAGIQKGNPQLLIGGEDYKGVSISKATYLAPLDGDLGAAGIHYNASPSCARVGDRFILGSTLGVVKSVIDELKEPSGKAAEGQTLLKVDLDQAAAALDDNREALVSQNMLKEGNTREEAEGEVGVLLRILQAIQSASLRMAAEPDSLSLELTAGPK